MPKSASISKPKPKSHHTPKRKSTRAPRSPTSEQMAASPAPTTFTSTTLNTHQNATPNPNTSTTPDADADPFPSLHDKPLRMRYRIARGEQGVLTFEPYKSLLLPHWRFKDPDVARASATALQTRFETYAAARDFVGMDMARKFLQMGVTRARRYANYAGGRKYDAATGKQLAKGKEFKGREEKMQASEIFRGVLEHCRASEVYAECREEFLAEQRAWDAGAANGVQVDARTGQVVTGGSGAAESTGRRRSARRKESPPSVG